FQSFRARHPAWTFEYKPEGSDAGIVQFSARGIDFVGTDIPPAAIKDRLPIESDAFPTVGGAVVLIYNLPRFTGDLRLTPDLIAGIFSGAIRKWSDPALVAMNPSTSLADAPIATVHRSDGSGTTYAFTEYLSKVNADWNKKAGAGARIEWANGTGASGSD